MPHRKNRAHLTEWNDDEWNSQENSWQESFFGKGKSKKKGGSGKGKGSYNFDTKGKEVLKCSWNEGKFKKGKSKGKAHLSQDAEEGASTTPSAEGTTWDDQEYSQKQSYDQE